MWKGESKYETAESTIKNGNHLAEGFPISSFW